MRHLKRTIFCFFILVSCSHQARQYSHDKQVAGDANCNLIAEQFIVDAPYRTRPIEFSKELKGDEEGFYFFDPVMLEHSMLIFDQGTILRPGFFRSDNFSDILKVKVVMDKRGQFYGIDKTIKSFPWKDGKDFVLNHASFLGDESIAFAGEIELRRKKKRGRQYWHMISLTNNHEGFYFDTEFIRQAEYELKRRGIWEKNTRLNLLPPKRFMKLNHGKHLSRLEKYYSLLAFVDFWNSNPNKAESLWTDLSSERGIAEKPYELLKKISERKWNVAELKIVDDLFLKFYQDYGEELVNSGILLDKKSERISKKLESFWQDRDNDAFNLVLDDYYFSHDHRAQFSWYSPRIDKLKLHPSTDLSDEIVGYYSEKIEAFMKREIPDFIYNISHSSWDKKSSYMLAESVHKLIGGPLRELKLSRSPKRRLAQNAGSRFMAELFESFNDNLEDLQVKNKVILIVNDNIDHGIEVEKLRLKFYRAGAKKVYTLSFGRNRRVARIPSS